MVSDNLTKTPSEWVLAHGSDRLIRAYESGYYWWQGYLQEYRDLEYPEFEIRFAYNDYSSDFYPTEAALNLSAAYPGSRIVSWGYGEYIMLPIPGEEHKVLALAVKRFRVRKGIAVVLMAIALLMAGYWLI